MKLTFGLVSSCVLSSICAFAGSGSGSENSLVGFRPENVRHQRSTESKFDAELQPDSLREWMKRLSARPHHIGSAYGKENAEFLKSKYSLWGFDAGIEEFDVLFPTPKSRLLEMTAPEHYTAKLTEPAVADDPTSGQSDEQLPTYNAYSIDGDVTGQLVYVNYGVPKDYEELDSRGIDVKGKIVIARYGGSWRGIKPKVAAEHGAIGCIIYSDPREDGYFEGDVYPKGSWRNENGAQRGSVADMPVFAGDPLTPGVGATKDAKRIPIGEAKTLTKIPVLPISYSDAAPLLKSMAGPVAPADWRGALPITYHIGPGPATVHLAVTFNWGTVPAYDVIATLKGSELPDEWIVRGNHHDAWVNGAEDPLSGQVAMLAEARSIGLLAKAGWKPKRTIVFCSWDGEEPGLLGSTEWAEAHADVLRQKAVAYINSDSNDRGFLSVGGSHTLEKFVNQIAREVTDPEKGIPVADRLRDQTILQGSPEDRKEARDRREFHLYALGSGSDYTPFLQHLGIAALSVGYGGESPGGVYHSIYDDFAHYMRFGDPTFRYGVALAQTSGRMILRLADADYLPFEFTNIAETVGKYSKEVTKLADDMRDETEELNRRIQDKVFEAVSDPQVTTIVPKPKDPVPFLNFAPLQNAVSVLQRSAGNFDQAMNEIRDGKKSLSPASAKSLDAILMKAEQALTHQEGLPRRPWFVHQIYAPGLYTGYGVKTLPGIREAIEQRNWTEASSQIGVVAGVLGAYSAQIDGATKLVSEAAATR